MNNIPTPNGYIKTFYVLGNEKGNGFINHSSSKILITDPLRSRHFKNSKEALDFKMKNKNNYKDELFVHHVRVIVELIYS